MLSHVVATAPRTIRGARPRDRRGSWVAIPAAAGVAAHLWAMLGHDHGAMNALLAVMTAICALCAVEVAVAPSRRGLRTVLGMSWAMIAVHLALLIGLGPVAAQDHTAHLAGPVAALADAGPAGAAPPVDLSMLLILILELLIAACAATALRARRD